MRVPQTRHEIPLDKGAYSLKGHLLSRFLEPFEGYALPQDPSLAQFVTQQLQSGKYQSYEEMVEAGLGLLQEHEAETDRLAEKLRPAAERFKRGEPGIAFDAEEIIRRGKKRLAAEQR